MTSLSRHARIAGLLYLTLLTAPLRLIYIPNKLFVAGNASATANNIAAHETLFRLGILSDLFTATMAIFLMLALYRLFKGVDEGLARLVVILGALMVTPVSTPSMTQLRYCSPGVQISSLSSASRRATPSSWCSCACMAKGYLRTRYFGDSRCSPSACWCTGRDSFRASSASGQCSTASPIWRRASRAYCGRNMSRGSLIGFSRSCSASSPPCCGSSSWVPRSGSPCRPPCDPCGD
jgi:Domain of unknown function (DUF4386)